MSIYGQYLSEAEQWTLDSPNFTPLVHRNFVGDTPDSGYDDIEKKCDPCTFFDHTAFAQGRRPSQFRRRDLEDFCNIWLRAQPGNSPGHDPICGVWFMDQWRMVSENAVTIVQYKTFKICVRAGLGAGEIMFVP